ncbi:MAG: SNF2 family helicase [Bernardetiaceae bacterium]|jgi:SNF2 family DNA or RNA helicase|nr:SNF2 family helicase [Bernardetiaceae bacterium]
MNVSPKHPFQIVYSLFRHPHLGYLFESFAVQSNANGELTLAYQNISAENAHDFATGLDDDDYELIRLMDSIQQDQIARKYANKRMPPVDFLLRTFDAKVNNKDLQKTITKEIETKRARIMELLIKAAGANLEGVRPKPLYAMANDGTPTGRLITIEPEPASIRFHFERTPESTVYYPTMKHAGQKVDFQLKGAVLICDAPAWLLLNHRLYAFLPALEGPKLQPFLDKRNINIARKFEEMYYRQFVMSLVETFDVRAQGFQIENFQTEPQAELILVDQPTATQGNLFGQADAVQPSGKITFELAFRYDRFVFKADSLSPLSVKMEKENDDYTFYKVHRQLPKEQATLTWLQNRGLKLSNGTITLDKSLAFAWLLRHRDDWQAQGYQLITQPSESDDKPRYFFGKPTLELTISENIDWFDIHANVRFGEFVIPFQKLRRYILNRQAEFKLPDGTIAVIPEDWFAQYSEAFGFMHEADDQTTLRKHHLILLQNLENNGLAQVNMSQQLRSFSEVDHIDDYPLPQGLRGELRPYQKTGYNWLRFLNQHRFGGCLADDMGLGKTVQTLALLLAEKEQRLVQGEPHQASLLIMPTSLLYNWEMEARKFAPSLRVATYTGSGRLKNQIVFEHADLVLTSYGIVRLDLDEVFASYTFNYIILDESQAIKNPDSAIARSVRTLQATHRLALTGTPVENSTLDLWSQLSFVNPGLLGGQTFFQRHFQRPIEKKHDAEKLTKLQQIIRPFVLRRHKSQVATELPPKIEHVQYVGMSDEQAKEYELIKSQYRNSILQHIEDKGLNNSQIYILQGLTKLRQIANHPALVNEAYQGGSGKLRDVLHKIETVVSEDHKALVFSQFVKHLELVRAELEARNIPYAYLDGSTKDRQAQVERFQFQPQVPVFLISLKAGGTGLNLTAADYVFLLDPWWNPAVEAQATDRAHRIGQTNQVMIYKFISQNTVEEKILDLQKKKLSLAHGLIKTEESLVKNLTTDDIRDLLA